MVLTQFARHNSALTERKCECFVKVFNNFVEKFVEKGAVQTERPRKRKELAHIAQYQCTLSPMRAEFSCSDPETNTSAVAERV